jgi:hypothetical protein
MIRSWPQQAHRLGPSRQTAQYRSWPRRGKAIGKTPAAQEAG